MSADAFETARLRFRPFTSADAPLLFDLDSDPEVMRWLSGGAPTPLDLIEREILPGFIAATTPGDGRGYWAAVEKATGEFAGWFSLRPPAGRALREADLGYRLRRSAWGRGLATEGARALVARAFNELGLERLTASTYEENVASQRVLEKVGFTLIRRHRLTPEAVAAQSTFAPTSNDPWPGDDLDYVLLRAGA